MKIISGVGVCENTIVLSASLKSLMNSYLRGVNILRQSMKPLITITLRDYSLLDRCSDEESYFCYSTVLTDMFSIPEDNGILAAKLETLIFPAPDELTVAVYPFALMRRKWLRFSKSLG